MGSEPRAPEPCRGLPEMLETWYRLRRCERSGRIYAAVGLVPLFRRMAALFGETLPEPQSRSLARDEAERTRLRARYHEMVNVISVLIQLPLVGMAWSLGHRALTAYAALLLLPHALSVMLERYKRAICDDLLGSGLSAEAIAPDPTVSKPGACPPRPSGGFFGPFPCETERLYVRLGVEGFRRFVLWLMRVTSGEGRAMSFRNVVGGRAGLAAFEAETCTAELTHLFGTTLHVPFAIVFVRDRYVPGVLFVVFLWWLNLVCALLQRQHRVRLQPLLRRGASRGSGRESA